MRLLLGVFRMECLCIFGKNSKRRPGSSEHWILAESIISPCCQVVGPMCQYLAEHEVFQEATRGENRTDADGQTRECVSTSKMSFLHVLSSSLRWFIAKGKQSLTNLSTYSTILYMVTLCFSTLAVVFCLLLCWIRPSYGCSLAISLETMLQTRQTPSMGDKNRWPLDFFCSPTWQIPGGKPPQQFPFPSLLLFFSFYSKQQVIEIL